MGRAGVQTNAAQGEPASEGDACHGEADEDGELVVDVAVDGLEGEEEEDFEGDEREAGCGGAGGGGGTGAMETTADSSLTTPRLKKTPGAPCAQNDSRYQDDEERGEDAGEGNLGGGAEEAGVTRFELRAPEHYVEVIGDGGEVAIDWASR